MTADTQHRAFLRGHTKGVASVHFAPDGGLLASCGADKTIRIWSPSADATNSKQTLAGHDFGVSDVVWHPSGHYLASASDDKTLGLWDVETGTRLRKMEGHTHFVYCCKFNPLGNVLASGSMDESIRLWDTRIGRQLRAIPAHADPVLSLDISSDGTVIASGSSDGLSRFWDLSTGLILRTFKDAGEHVPIVCSVAFAPSGRYLLESTLAPDALLRLWDWKRGTHGTVVRRLRGHKCMAYSMQLAFVHSSCCMAASEDGMLCLWNINTSKLMKYSVNHVEVSAEFLKAREASNSAQVRTYSKLSHTEKLNYGLPPLMPDPRSVVAMDVSFATGHVATAQVGDEEHGVYVSDLPPPP